jgi:TonB family protein
MRMNPLLLFLSLSFFSVNLIGQTDTTIYYSKYGIIVPSIDSSVYYEKFVTDKKNKMTLSSFMKKDDKWQNETVVKISKKTDSSFLMTTKEKQTRVFHKTDSGYIIKDYLDSKLIQTGSARLIFPLIRSGLWKTYSPITGEIISENLFYNDHMIFYKYWISKSSFIQDSSRHIDTPAKFIGGDPALTYFINMNIVYPEDAKYNNIQGRVFINFIVTASGDVVGARATNKVDKDLENEAIRVIRLTRGQWIPAKSGEKSVNCFFTAPVTFQLK